MKKRIIKEPVKAIRAFCFECAGGSTRNVTNCVAFSCPLYVYRSGINPFRKKRELPEEIKAHLAEIKAIEQKIGIQ